MYHAENHLDRYCMLLFENHLTNVCDDDPIIIPIHHIRSYCLRLTEENDFKEISDLKNISDHGFTFAELKERNITSEILLSWSATIDLAEQYEMYLINQSLLSSTNDQVFYNCTSLWFGPFCRFTFDYSPSQSFYDIVKMTFETKRSFDNNAKMTCYTHLPCKTFLLCLDWREICDGNINCLDGSDEENCWQLEVNQCTDEEYRCNNGQCIPREFLRDAVGYPDCLDQTDESILSTLQDCFSNPSVTCEDHKCRPGRFEFPCGDGECTDGFSICSNSRSSFLTDDYCSNGILCLLQGKVIRGTFCYVCKRTKCIKQNCPSVFEFRSMPPIFGHVRLMFSNTVEDFDKKPLPVHVCYDEKLCGNIFPVTQYIGNLTCRHFNISEIGEHLLSISFEKAVQYIKNQFRKCSQTQNKFHYCNYSSMYQCANSRKCIPKQRLLDGLQDCPENDDEKYTQSCSLDDAHHRYQCLDEEQKCFSSIIMRNGFYDCKLGEDENSPVERYKLKHIYFPNICDGQPDLLPVKIEGQHETDETNCEYWPCDNVYTRCNQLWNCKDGVDEMSCPHSIGPTLRSYCRFFDGPLDTTCSSVNQTDEQRNYHVFLYSDSFDYLHCWNNTKSIPYKMFCDEAFFCELNGIAPFCGVLGYRTGRQSLCDYMSDISKSTDRFICALRVLNKFAPLIYFKLGNMSTYPLQLANVNPLDQSLIEQYSTVSYTSAEAWRCNRGISIRNRIDSNKTRLHCLCPPSYYGDECEYQNQRISITVQIRMVSNWTNPFIFLLTLIDHENNIESYDYIEYMPSRDCNTKYNRYLLYSTRPKNSSKSYSVKIDAFDHLKLIYQTSWIFPIQFPFLPVHRLAVLLKTPLSIMQFLGKNHCSSSCIHGKCVFYINQPNVTHCHCESGWSGIQCHIKHTCDCALSSLCISPSICLCPTGRFGHRCHLIQRSCQSQPCLNGGQCVLEDIRHRHPNYDRSICICRQGYTGNRCEYRQNQTEIDLSFDNLRTIPSSVLIHLIFVEQNAPPQRMSLMKKIQFDEYSTKIPTTTLFHLAFAQILSDYYLIIIRENLTHFEQISTKILSSHQCRSIFELFDESFANQHLLNRIKYRIQSTKTYC